MHSKDGEIVAKSWVHETFETITESQAQWPAVIFRHNKFYILILSLQIKNYTRIFYIFPFLNNFESLQISYQTSDGISLPVID